jgi:hypothetical protein
VPVVVSILAGGRDPASAAAFLGVPGVWDVLLSRTWEDRGVALGQMIRTAAEVPDAGGDAIVRRGLESLASGLDDGHVDDWLIPRATADAVSPALADALALHVSVAAAALAGGGEGGLAPADGAMLRGLGLLTVDRESAAVVEAALLRWVTAQPVPVWVSGPPPAFPAIVVPNAYLAVQDYGQKLNYGLNEAASERAAEDRAFFWNITVGLATGLVPGPWGLAAGVVEGYAAMWLGFDGTWDPGTDHGLSFGPAVPDRQALTDLSAEDWSYVNVMADMAENAFAGVTQALGPVHVDVPPATHWWDPIQGMVSVGPGDAVDAYRGHGRVYVPPNR